MALSKSAEITLTAPFPSDPQSLELAYAWHRHATTCINGGNTSLAEFKEYLASVLTTPGVRSWAIRAGGGLVGVVLFEPIWRGWELVDGNMHIALARSAWGTQAIQKALLAIIPQLFAEIPTLLRLTSQTPSKYRPGLAVADALGFKYEGKIVDALRIGGEIHALSVAGLTRKEFENGNFWRTQNNND